MARPEGCGTVLRLGLCTGAPDAGRTENSDPKCCSAGSARGCGFSSPEAQAAGTLGVPGRSVRNQASRPAGSCQLSGSGTRPSRAAVGGLVAVSGAGPPPRTACSLTLTCHTWSPSARLATPPGAHLFCIFSALCIVTGNISQAGTLTWLLFWGQVTGIDKPEKATCGQVVERGSETQAGCSHLPGPCPPTPQESRPA